MQVIWRQNCKHIANRALYMFMRKKIEVSFMLRNLQLGKSWLAEWRVITTRMKSSYILPSLSSLLVVFQMTSSIIWSRSKIQRSFWEGSLRVRRNSSIQESSLIRKMMPRDINSCDFSKYTCWLWIWSRQEIGKTVMGRKLEI